jgi:DNA-3-methyladenine glycosylase
MSTVPDLSRPALEVAPGLLGSVLSSMIGGHPVSIRLTEVEAYLGVDDPASHAFRGPTKRVEVMFGAPGHLYVYFTYGMHWCANVVCEPAGTASAVLLRAGEVTVGADTARARRPAARKDVELARGPARLATCLGLGSGQNGADLLAPDSLVRLQLAPSTAEKHIECGPRVGISRAVDQPWRFWFSGDPTVSAFRAGRPAAGR